MTWQENCLYLLIVPTLFMGTLLAALGVVKVVKWWQK